MSQTAITLAFEQHLADIQMGGQPVIPDEFVLANIPDLDLATPIDRAAGLPSAGQIVHRQLVDQRGKVNANGVAYSIIMDTRIGDFTFNAMYLLHKASGLVAMVVHKESEDKLKNQGVTQPGNSLVKSMIMEYQGAAVATNTTIDASTWQIDFSARLFGLDRDIQQQAHDHYGDAAFMGDGLLVRAGTGVNEFIVAAGLGYVAGLRAELKQQHSMVVASRPATIYADVYHAGTLLSDWDTILTITASTAPLVDYVDEAGYQHYVTPLAQLAANGAVTDLRGRGGLWWHEQRPKAHTPEQVGLDKLENWGWSHSYTDATSGAGKYATGKAVADGYNALNSSKLNAASYTANDVLAKLKTVDGANSGLDSDLLDGQHGAYYLAWANQTGKPATMPPSSHTHTWSQITDPPAQATRWPSKAEVGLSKVPNTDHTSAPTANTAVLRDASADIHARMLRSNYANQAVMSGALAFRVNNGTDNYVRYCSDPTAVRSWLAAAASVHTHPWSEITGIPVQATRWPTFAEVTGKPANSTTTVVQGVGASTTAVMSQKAVSNLLIGEGQTWSDVTASRVLGATYTNNRSRTIVIAVTIVLYPLQGVYVGPVLMARQVQTETQFGATYFVEIPSGATYKVVAHLLGLWAELS